MNDVAGRLCTVELYKEALKFSAAHFTLFSPTRRERLHGHDFFVSCALTAPVGPGGLIADYTGLKRALRRMCDAWDEALLLPGASPWLGIEAGGAFVYATFDGLRMPFVAEEVRVLPVANITLEALAGLFLDALIEGDGLSGVAELRRLVVKVSAGPGQSAQVVWEGAPAARWEGGPSW